MQNTDFRFQNFEFGFQKQVFYSRVPDGSPIPKVSFFYQSIVPTGLLLAMHPGRKRF